MSCRIIIETSARPEGGYRAQVVEGPAWARGYKALAEDREKADRALRNMVRGNPACSSVVDFLRSDC